MKIKEYEQCYEDELLRLWNQTLIADQISEKVFHEQVLFDDNFDPTLCLLAMEGERIVGFLVGMKRRVPYLDRGFEPDKAWICAMGVDTSRQRNKIATAMVAEFECRVSKRGAKIIHLGANSPNYFFPGIDQDAYKNAISFFTYIGYDMNGGAESMCRSLFNYQMSETIEKRRIEAEQKGYRFEKFTYPYSMKVLDFIGEEFGGGWKRNALTVLQKGEGPNLLWIVIDIKDNVVGFCMRKMDGYEHRFGPFGVKESLRSHGLGSILFELMMKDMAQNKIYQLYFLWTHGDGRRFYERHGVQVYRQFMQGKKMLEVQYEKV